MFYCKRCGERHNVLETRPSPAKSDVDTVDRNIDATWSVSLDCECPDCGQDVNLLDDPDFWDGRSTLDVCEHGTLHSRDVEVSCPKCRWEFRVDLVY